MRTSQRPLSASKYRGLSILEFLGCLIAIAGGLWIGATYFGLDLHSLAYTALDESNALDSLPEEWRPPAPQGHPSQLSEEEVASALQHEMVALRHEIAALRGVSPSDAAAESVPPNAGQTKEFWDRLRNIAKDEAALQLDSQAAASDANSDRVFALRSRVSRFASNAVDAIPTEGVDGELQLLGKDLSAWYIRASNHYHRGAELWSDRNAQASSAKFTEGWETADRQLQNEAQLLRNKAEAVRASLSRNYRGNFAAFGG